MEPSAFMNMMCTAPRLFPPASSKLAPAAMSDIPSLSRSPMFATDAPKLSLFDSAGPFDVLSFTSTVPSTAPFPPVMISLRNMTCTAPRPSPPASSPQAPATMSGIPSLSRSPMLATDMPKVSSSDSAGPPVVPPFIVTVPFTEPSAFMNIICTAPRVSPSTSVSVGAPAATSGVPSPSRSPIPATDVPK